MVRQAWTALLVPSAARPIVIDVEGVKVLVDPAGDAGMERSVYRYGSYEAGTLHVLHRCLRTGDVFFDVGSNIGIITLHAALLIGDAGKVHAFEPAPETYAILKHNIALNGATNVEAHCLAVGENAGAMPLHINPDPNRGEASLVDFWSRRGPSVAVPVESLDGFARARSIGRVRMIKLDIQGHELPALRGAASLLAGVDPPILCVEHCIATLPPGGRARDVHDHIVASGYRVFRLARGKEWPSPLVSVTAVGEIPPIENLFCFRPEHLAQLDPALFAGARS